MCSFIVGFCCLVIWQFLIAARLWLISPIILQFECCWLWFVFTLKSKLDFHAFTHRIMIFHGSCCTRDHVFTSIFSVFHMSRFRKKAIHVSRLDPFQTHYIMSMITCKNLNILFNCSWNKQSFYLKAQTIIGCPSLQLQGCKFGNLKKLHVLSSINTPLFIWRRKSFSFHIFSKFLVESCRVKIFIFG